MTKPLAPEIDANLLTQRVQRVDPVLLAAITLRASRWADLFIARNRPQWDRYMATARAQMIEYTIWLRDQPPGRGE